MTTPKASQSPGREREEVPHLLMVPLDGSSVAEQALLVAADLIVVGTHGARGVERLLVGCVADKVIRGALQPVLVVPTRKDEE